jgi:hypothetical protein
MRRQLSSSLTFFYKFIFSTIWISGFGFGALQLFLLSDSLRGQGGPLPPEIKWTFLLVWIAGSTVFLWFCAPLKRVQVDDETLYASNFFREIRVPLRTIDHVSENRFVNIHPVTVHLKTETAFGRKIVFMPTARFFSLFTGHPVVKDLEEWVRRASQSDG